MGGSVRMSKDEKRKAILDIYHKTKSVFMEKEIVTLATKAGVNSNTIVDINQSLVDDGVVDKENIGGTNYFWSFPAKKDRLVQVQHEAALQAIEALKLQVQEATVKLQDAKRGREEESDEAGEGDDEKETRAGKIRRLNEISVERKKLEAELETLKENDPQALADLEKELQLVTESAHRWTDNVFNCKSFLTKKRGMDRKEADKVLQIPSDFDYPDDAIGGK